MSRRNKTRVPSSMICDIDLLELSLATDEVEKQQAKIYELVKKARSKGISWDRIAFIIGVTRQSVSRQFGPYCEEKHGEGSEGMLRPQPPDRGGHGGRDS